MLVWSVGTIHRPSSSQSNLSEAQEQNQMGDILTKGRAEPHPAYEDTWEQGKAIF